MQTIKKYYEENILPKLEISSFIPRQLRLDEESVLLYKRVWKKWTKKQQAIFAHMESVEADGFYEGMYERINYTAFVNNLLI